MSRSRRFVVAAAQLLLAACFTLNAYAQPRDREGGHGHQHEIRHVLLVSIDGMHALDFRNCAKGISGVNGGKPYCPHLAALARNGVDYLDTTTSKPSDSFPGLMALVSGGSPRTVGAFYDVAFDRSLDPPKDTTGNGVAGGSCTPGGTPIGTTTEYDEGIDIDQTKLNGGAPSGDGGINVNQSELSRARPEARLRAGLPVELCAHQHYFRSGPSRGRLHRVDRQASVVFFSVGSWKWRQP